MRRRELECEALCDAIPREGRNKTYPSSEGMAFLLCRIVCRLAMIANDDSQRLITYAITKQAL
jgi:hypothetical protein